ncbi:uncharacterized protein PRCAT00002703001 [Priceomyces carsonii]|uniref:uncharacterized protein n=1 Tax=Priceomyces carsonii TaxID=28549 RepID=UPI002EDB3EF1|nr:unnamed protein product [Priceomyces carsonii]
MAGSNSPPRSVEVSDNAGSSSSVSKANKVLNTKGDERASVIVKFMRSIFGYRKTSLTFFVFLALFFTVILTFLNNSLEYSILLPADKFESEILETSWSDLQHIALSEHSYGSHGNDFVHHFLQDKIVSLIEDKSYIEYDNDLNYTNNILVKPFDSKSVWYYESNNLLVRINGSNMDLPAILVSAHFDSVPSSYGVTDDGMGIASLLGLLMYYSSKSTSQPTRSIILNFNNNEEFGLYGARSFLSHPWFENIKYFLNLEGAGCGGMATLFRGTDYGILKYFKNVRYPYGNSIYQQGFNNKLIHSETDYFVYKDVGGIRGIDLAFTKPRDLYHTPEDNIKNIDKKSLWHMLSNTLDFVGHIASRQIDLDVENKGSEAKASRDFAFFTSAFNKFFVFPISTLIVFNIVSLVVIPIFCLPLFVIIFNFKRNWNISFINFIKYPASLCVSIFVVNVIVNDYIVKVNEFLPNSSCGLIVSTLVSTFLLFNYFTLNAINLLFRKFKVKVHDEKLISILQNGFFYWIFLIYSTIKLSENKIGDDHTGEYPLVSLFLLQSVASIIGLLGWVFKSARKYPHISEDMQPLLARDDHSDYGSNQATHDAGLSSLCSSFSVINPDELHIRKCETSFSYDWSLQFLSIVPLSSLIIYNSGWLVFEGLNKGVQESYYDELYVFQFLMAFSITWVIPVLPFVFKLNRIIVLILILITLQGLVGIYVREPFDQQNPLKLRFLQTVDLSVSPNVSYVNVQGRNTAPISQILSDVPSFKDSKEPLNCHTLSKGLASGLQVCTYKSMLQPHLVSGAHGFEDYIEVDVLQNSTTNFGNPFGLITGELKITVPNNRVCNLNFNLSEDTTEIMTKEMLQISPVRIVTVYANGKNHVNSSFISAKNDYSALAVPEGSSRDKQGNYIFKDLDGIEELRLNKLDWNSVYHVGLQWVPSVVEELDSQTEAIELNKLGVKIDCLWTDTAGSPDEKIGQSVPAWTELLHYTPNYVNWANLDSGLVSVSTYVEL